MQIANESNWRTEDLKVLVDEITGMQEYRKGRHLNDDTLLLFRTSRKIDERQTFEFQGSYIPRPATYTKRHKDFYHTVIVEIHSAKRLKMDVLDRLSLATSDAAQDMHPEFVEQVAAAIFWALTDPWTPSIDLSWARDCNMKSTTKNRKSKVALERRIEELKLKQKKALDNAQWWVRDIDRQIEELRKRQGKL